MQTSTAAPDVKKKGTKGRRELVLSPEVEQRIRTLYAHNKSSKRTARAVGHSVQVICRVLGIRYGKPKERVKKTCFNWDNYRNSIIL